MVVGIEIGTDLPHWVIFFPHPYELFFADFDVLRHFPASEPIAVANLGIYLVITVLEIVGRSSRATQKKAPFQCARNNSIIS